MRNKVKYTYNPPAKQQKQFKGSTKEVQSGTNYVTYKLNTNNVNQNALESVRKKQLGYTSQERKCGMNILEFFFHVTP